MTQPAKLDLETVISWVLRLGVLSSMGIIGGGVVMWILAGQTGYAAHQYPTSLPQIWSGLVVWRPLAVVQAGLLVLILTPVIQVAASVAMFIKDRDRIFASLAMAVLTLLLLGIFYGAGGH